MPTPRIIPILYLLILLSVKSSSTDQSLWLLYPNLMGNRELNHAKTTGETVKNNQNTLFTEHHTDHVIQSLLGE